MKRSERIYILLGVLAVVCIAAFAAARIERHKENIKNSDEIILEIPQESVTALSWENESGAVALHKDGAWLYDEDEAFPVDEEKVGEMLSQFEAFGVAFIIEDVEDYGQYGLDDPVCTIDLDTEDADYEITLGDYSKMDSQRYVSIGDGNVYLVKNDPLDQFDAVLDDMLDDDETPLLSQAEGIAFSGEQDYTVTYTEDSSDTYCADDVYFTQRGGASVPLDTTNVNNYLSNISYLSLDDYVTYNATQEELAACGLDDPELTVSINYTSEDEEGKETDESFILHISRDPEEREEAEKKSDEAAQKGAAEAAEGDAAIADEEAAAGDAAFADEDTFAGDAAFADESGEGDEDEEEITAYARVGESQILYRISSGDYKKLMAASYDDLRHKELLTADFEDVEQIDISLEGVSYTLASEKKKGERTWYYQGEELDTSRLQDALGALEADGFTQEQPEKKEEISLTVHLDNENFPEVSIALYRYDGDKCLAVVDGSPVAFVTRSLVVELTEAVNSIVL